MGKTLSLNINDSYKISPDVTILPVLQLPQYLRSKFAYEPTDYAVSQAFGRSHVKVLNDETYQLLNHFCDGASLFDAIRHFSADKNCPPEQVLSEAGLILIELIAGKFLVRVDSEEAIAMTPTLTEGTEVGDGYHVLRCVRMLQDSEIYEMAIQDSATQRRAALKIARPSNPEMAYLIDNEARILTHLGGVVTPRLHSKGVWNEQPYLLMDWIEGASLYDTISRFEHDYAHTQRTRRYELAVRLVEAYAALHDQRVLQTDIHPGNVIVTNDNEVRIIDFGHARLVGESYYSSAGVAQYRDPEYAQFALGNGAFRPRSMRGEQYSIAAMAFQLLSHKAYADGKYLLFDLESDSVWRKILDNDPLPLVTFIDTCPAEVESAIRTALCKSPRDRHRTTRLFADKFRKALEKSEQEKVERLSAMDRRNDLISAGQSQGADGENDNARRDLENAPASLRATDAAQYLVNDFVRLSKPHGEWYDRVFESAPACSVNFGGAGVAYGLYRLASLQEDATLLARADLWCQRTHERTQSSLAFNSETIDIKVASVGKIAIYHSITGIHLVHALISKARCDYASQRQAIWNFLESAREPCENVDLTLGKASALLGASLLLENLPANDEEMRAALTAFGDAILQEVWSLIDSAGPILAGKPTDYYGIAHGWAGLMYSALRWSAASHKAPPASLSVRLHELISEAMEYDGQLWWPYMVDYRGPGGVSWCNGNSGWVFLWTEAHRAFHDDLYLELAERTAETTWRSPDNHPNLCCGLAGRVYSQLHLFQYTGQRKWLDRGRELSNRMAGYAGRGYSLYKGMTGIVLAAAETWQPELASMPLFDRDSPT